MKIRGRHRDGQDLQGTAGTQRQENEHNREQAGNTARAERKAARKRRRTARKARRTVQLAPPVAVPGSLRVPRAGALWAIAVLVLASAGVSFAESYRGLFLWAHHHGLTGPWAAIWPLQVDVFIAVGELALFIALVDQWSRRSRIGAWTVTLAGLAVSVAGNVGHVSGHLLSNRATAAVPPLAAAAALAVGLGVLKRVVENQHREPSQDRPAGGPPWLPLTDSGAVPSDALAAAKASLAATVKAGNPWSVNQLSERFSLTRAQATKARAAVLGETNGSGHEPEGETVRT